MSALLDIINDPKNIDHVIAAAIVCVCFLFGAIASMGLIMLKNYKSKVVAEIGNSSLGSSIRMDKKFNDQDIILAVFDQKIKELDEDSKQHKESITDSHNRMTAHVEKHHTKD